MADVRLGKELLVKTGNKVGMLTEVTSAISETGANIQAISAYAVGKDAYFRIVTSDNKKAEDALKAKGYGITEKENVLVGLENKPGAAKEMASKLKDANIDLSYIYGTTYGEGPALIVFNSNDNAKAVETLK